MISQLLKRRPVAEAVVDPTELEFQRLKTAIHEELVETLDLSVVEQIDEELLGAEIRRLAEDICRGVRKQLSEAGHQRMLDELMEEIFGLGPLEKLMADSTVSDILVNGPHEVFVERRGRLERT